MECMAGGEKAIYNGMNRVIGSAGRAMITGLRIVGRRGLIAVGRGAAQGAVAAAISDAFKESIKKQVSVKVNFLEV